LGEYGGYLGEIRGKSDERSAGIDGGAGILQLECLLAKGETFKGDFPVASSTDGKPSDLAGIMIFIVPSKHSFATIIFILVCVAKVKSKHLVVNQLPRRQPPKNEKSFLLRGEGIHHVR
jgi:hypothetical protein